MKLKDLFALGVSNSQPTKGKQVGGRHDEFACLDSPLVWTRVADHVRTALASLAIHGYKIAAEDPADKLEKMGFRTSTPFLLVAVTGWMEACPARSTGTIRLFSPSHNLPSEFVKKYDLLESLDKSRETVHDYAWSFKTSPEQSQFESRIYGPVRFPATRTDVHLAPGSS